MVPVADLSSSARRRRSDVWDECVQTLTRAALIPFRRLYGSGVWNVYVPAPWPVTECWRRTQVSAGFYRLDRSVGGTKTHTWFVTTTIQQTVAIKTAPTPSIKSTLRSWRTRPSPFRSSWVAMRKCCGATTTSTTNEQCPLNCGYLETVFPSSPFPL